VRYGLGIDVGTSAIKVAVRYNGRTQPFPLDDETAAPPVQDGAEPSAQALAVVLESVVNTARSRLGGPPDSIALSYPAVAGQHGQDRLTEAARLAGLTDVTLVSDVRAAATHYATREQLGHGALIAVYDLGARGFSTAVTRVTGAGATIIGAVKGAEGVAGDDFDIAVLAHVDLLTKGAVTRLDPEEPAAAIDLERLRRECRRAKEALSEQESASINVLLPDAAAGSGAFVRQSEVSLTRDALESMLWAPLESTVTATGHALDSARVTPEQLSGVVLIGGSARIPLVADLLTTSFGFGVHPDPDLTDAVALGLAQHASPSPALPVPVPEARPPFDLRELVARRPLLVAAIAVAVLLLGGIGFLALGRGASASTSTARGAEAGAATPTTSGRAAATHRAGAGSGSTSSVGKIKPSETQPVSTTDAGSSKQPSAPATTTAAAPTTPSGSATTTPGTPTSTSPGASATATASPSSGVVAVRIGDACYDIAHLNSKGQFPEVPCPK
jgi:actin-like ATPase involved in cell morphogenesis